ncbi:MAG: ATP-binding protein [Gammaproteobacteria bacterium]|nr:ATP-binding protein [Gammaproteobacteria bacterium]
MKSAHFSVDAALLRELGERLIGRAHIALAELVKNAYDADAHTCQIDIDLDRDRIVVTDDGHGISEQEFHEYWLRVGTTHRAEERVSRNLARPMTGSKGIGRLSAQFLAEEMELQSNSTSNPDQKLFAFVDWRTIQSGKDIQTVSVDWDSTLEAGSYPDSSRVGTEIKLSGLRTAWDTDAIEALGRDVWMLRSPFREAGRQTRGKTAYDFYIDLNAPDLASAKDSFDKMHRTLFSNWRARITGSLEDGRGRRGAGATIMVEFAKDYPDGLEDSQSFRETVGFPVERRSEPLSSSDDQTGSSPQSPALDKARFEVMIFKPEGRQPDQLPVKEMREYLRTYGNVSVYDAGFRLPYYGSSKDLGGHDWLNIGADQGRRLIASELLPERLKIPGRYMLDLPNPGRIFGAVDVDTNHERHAFRQHESSGDWLQIQPGRDRLTPNNSFKQLQELVRFSLDFYANRYRALADRQLQAQKGAVKPSHALTGAIQTLERNKPSLPAEVYQEVKRDLVTVQRAVKTESDALDSRAAILGPLATAGMAALAMDHEIAREANLVADVANRLKKLSEEVPSPTLDGAVADLNNFHNRFNSYRELFSPLADAEDREATRRLSVSLIANQVVKAVRPRMPRVAFDFSGIPRDLRFPVGAFVEWSAVLQNVLFNAWDAMLDCDLKRVRFDGIVERRNQRLRISDTGVGLAVPVEESNLLFEPFERRTEINFANRSVALGGQGLGLAIVRMISSQRGAEVRFVEPKKGFSTTIEVAWKGL